MQAKKQRDRKWPVASAEFAEIPDIVMITVHLNICLRANNKLRHRECPVASIGFAEIPDIVMVVHIVVYWNYPSFGRITSLYYS